MKRDGRISGQQTLNGLVELQRVFSSHVQHHKVLQALHLSFNDLTSVVALNLFPDGGEDWQELLVNNDTVVELEVPMQPKQNVIIAKQTPLKKYLIGKSKSQQIKLAIALELLKD